MNLSRRPLPSSRDDGTVPRLLRRLVSKIPGRWRGAVMLTALTVFFPLWITVVVWEAVAGDDGSPVPQVETGSPPH